MKPIEKRFESHEFRAIEGKDMTVGGYAAVFNRAVKIETYVGAFNEEIAPGAFSSSIAGGDIRALWSHNTDIVIGRTKNGSLTLREDNVGLAFELTMPNTTDGKNAYELIRGGYVTGVSFGFSIKKEEWRKADKGELDNRRILDVELFEISPTAFPAYEQTSVAARSTEEALKEAQTKWAFEQRDAQERMRALDFKEKKFKLARMVAKHYH